VRTYNSTFARETVRANVKLYVRPWSFKLLEGENDCYRGCGIPIIMRHINKIQSNSDPTVQSLVNALTLTASLKSRFGSVLTDQEYITSGVSRIRSWGA